MLFRSKKTEEIEAVSKELQLLLDTSDFCVSVTVQSSEGWKAKLGSFHLSLRGPLSRQEEEDVWVYLSRVPNMSFVYVDKNRYQLFKN